MKLNQILVVVFCVVMQQGHAAMPERYLNAVDKISKQYSEQMKTFLRSLNPKQTGFNDAQKAQYCGMIDQYIDHMYAVTEKYRGDLPLSYARLTKQDLIQQVLASKEMQLVKGYNIECTFN